MTSGQASVLFFVSFSAAFALWRQVTAEFLKQNGETSEIGYPTFVLEIVWDFWRALAIRLGEEKKLPIGVYMHGILIIFAYGMLIIAFIRPSAELSF